MTSNYNFNNINTTANNYSIIIITINCFELYMFTFSYPLFKIYLKIILTDIS